MRSHTAPALGGLGLVVIVTGTFLPWLKSGATTRNSYQAGGSMRRLLGVHGLLGDALRVWPFVGLVCACVVVLFALGLRRWAAGLGLIAGLVAAGVSIGALAVRGTALVAPATVGPAVTIAGAAAVIFTSSLLLRDRPVPLPRS